MALYIPYSIFHLARLLYVRPETLGPYYVRLLLETMEKEYHKINVIISILTPLVALLYD
jgi:hypothetical protein